MRYAYTLACSTSPSTSLWMVLRESEWKAKKEGKYPRTLSVGFKIVVCCRSTLNPRMMWSIHIRVRERSKYCFIERCLVFIMCLLKKCLCEWVLGTQNAFYICTKNIKLYDGEFYPIFFVILTLISLFSSWFMRWISCFIVRFLKIKNIFFVHFNQKLFLSIFNFFQI